MNKKCPFCGVIPTVYDGTGDLRMEHKTDCYFVVSGLCSIQDWVVGKRAIEAWNKSPKDKYKKMWNRMKATYKQVICPPKTAELEIMRLIEEEYNKPG
jgi:hypothetical protein